MSLKSRALPLFLTVMFLANRSGAVWGPLVYPAYAREDVQLDPIYFSQDSLVTAQPFSLTLNSQVAGTIRYTCNGSLPDVTSTAYEGPIFIDKPTVIRAQMFDDTGNPIGDVYTRSYLIVTYSQTIPVISIVSDWTHLNWLHDYPLEHGQNCERPVNIEYFAPGGQVQFNVQAGMRIHGGKSRLYSLKKSYRLYFRKAYGGPGNLEYPLFEDSAVTKFDKLVLRAGFNDSFTYADSAGHPKAQAFTAKYIGDQVVRNLHRDMGQPIAHGCWVLLYLNGEYWGLYNLTERIDQQYFRAYSDKDSDWDVIKKEVGLTHTADNQWVDREVVVDGSYEAWQATQNWVGSADFYNPGNIGVLEWMVDLENLFSYMFLQAYVQNYDWPGNNWIIYRRSDPMATGNEAKWRMMAWDAEYSFGSGSDGFAADKNTLVRVYSPHDSITRLLEKPFIGNCELKHRFVQRAREYLGVENLQHKPETEVGQLAGERVKAEILKQAAIVRPFIQMEAERWAPEMNVALFDQNIQEALHFVDTRETVILEHLDILRYQTFTQCQ